jgi:peptidoglycan/xylan/chitin deacetylase (PgdA/CDA1 family)
VDRRVFLSLASATALVTLAGCTTTGFALGSPSPVPSSDTPHPPPPPTPTPTPTPSFSAPTLVKVALPVGGITALPGPGMLMAWTVDDGTSSAVVQKYVEFAASTGLRLTFFLNGQNPAWSDHVDLLRPLVTSGQIQLGNHTWDHPNLTRLSDAAVVAELQRSHDFISSTYGVDARPYWRPPYGFRNPRVDHLAASIGYSTPVLWYGSLSDSGLITPQQVVDFATQWFLPQHIVIGHANHDPVTTVFPQLADLLATRHLQPVTLNDVFIRP